jgi:undecaprenyl diphosphate synthase
MRIPKHIGIIPDGNRRWAQKNGLAREDGYGHGISPGMELFHLCQELGVKEMTFYGFTVDNTKRPSAQRISFSDACVKAVEALSHEDAELLVLGNTNSAMFPKELLPYTSRQIFGKGGMKINFLVNYSFEWDLNFRAEKSDSNTSDVETACAGICRTLGPTMASADVSRVDLIIRWGGRRRLSGFLPIQSVYSDIYVVDDYWPDFTPAHVHDALAWYARQDVTLGG